MATKENAPHTRSRIESADDNKDVRHGHFVLQKTVCFLDVASVLAVSDSPKCPHHVIKLVVNGKSKRGHGLTIVGLF